MRPWSPTPNKWCIKPVNPVQFKSIFNNGQKIQMRNQIPDERGGGNGGEEKLPDTTHWEEPDSNEDWVIVDGGIMNHYRVQV